MAIRTTTRTASIPTGLAIFVAGVLLIDVIGLGAVVGVMWRGHIVGDWISFYTGGSLIRTGHASQLYDADAQAALQRQLFGGTNAMGYGLPAYVAIALAPLTKLSFAASFLVWLLINVALVAVLLRLSWRWLESVPVPLRSVFLVCALSITALEVLMQGQVDLFVLAGCAGCYALLRAERPFTGGAVLALALCKPHLAAAVVLLLIVKGQWRALAGLTAAGVPLLIVPALLFGPRLLVEQARLLLSFTGTANDLGVNAPMMINIRGTVASITNSSNVWLWLPLLALIAVVALVVAVGVWRERPALHPQSWALAFTLPLLYSPHVHVQSLVLLIGAAGLYLVDSQSSARPIDNIKSVLYPLIAVTMLWSISLWGLSLMALLIMASYSMFARRWPQPAAALERLPERDALALAS